MSQKRQPTVLPTWTLQLVLYLLPLDTTRYDCRIAHLAQFISFLHTVSYLTRSLSDFVDLLRFRVIPAWLDVFYSSFTQLLCNVTCWVELRALYRTTVINSGNSDADIESLGQSLPDMASASPRCAWGDAWLKHHSPCRRLDTECRHGRPLGSWELDFEALEAALA